MKMFPNQLILCIICLIFSSVHTEKVSIKYKMLDETNRLLKDSHAKKINPFITNTLSKVLLLAVEGLTPSLLSRVATPALDRLASRGSLSRSSWLKKKHHHHHQGKPRFGASYMILIITRLVPEFPSETLPTLAAIATGQHTEVGQDLTEGPRDDCCR